MQSISSDLGTGAHGRFRTRVEKELADAFTVLSDGAAVTWDCDNKKFPTAKLTSTQSFTINMTNVMDGAYGIFKLTTDTASAITLTFDSDFTNKSGNATLTSYTFPAVTAQEYFLSFVVDGTTIEWFGLTLTKLGARLGRLANQSIASGATGAAISWDTEQYDNGGLWAAGNPTRITIPGSGPKRALITGFAQYAAIVGAANARRIVGYVNGASVSSTHGAFSEIAPVASRITDIPIAFQIDCVGGDYIELFAIQSQGSALNVVCAINVTVENR